MIIIFQLIILASLIYIIYVLSYSLIFGAPYAAIGKRRLNSMLDLLDLEKGKRLVDLGSGDGRIVEAAGKRGVNAYGFEINFMLYIISKIKLRKQSNTHIIQADYWKQDLSSFDYITIYGTQHMVNRMEKKLQKELPSGSKVVTNHYKFPNWKISRENEDTYLYIKK